MDFFFPDDFFGGRDQIARELLAPETPRAPHQMRQEDPVLFSELVPVVIVWQNSAKTP